MASTSATALRQLLARNHSGAYKSGAQGRGFVCSDVDARTQRATVRRLPGITKLVNRYFPRPRSASPARLRLFTLPDGVRAVSSSARLGETIHRQVMHELFCAPATVCRCVGTGATPPLHAQKPSVRVCVAAAKQFMAAHFLAPVAGELIIANRTLPIATRLDALALSVAPAPAAPPLPAGQAGARRAAVPDGSLLAPQAFRGPEASAASREGQGSVTLVSWKTGTGPRNDIELRRHQAQAAFEWATLTGSHGVSVSAAYIVYLCAGMNSKTHRTQGFYHAEPLDAAMAADLYTVIKRKAAAAIVRAQSKAKPRARSRTSTKKRR